MKENKPFADTVVILQTCHSINSRVAKVASPVQEHVWALYYNARFRLGTARALCYNAPYRYGVSGRLSPRFGVRFWTPKRAPFVGKIFAAGRKIVQVSIASAGARQKFRILLCYWIRVVCSSASNCSPRPANVYASRSVWTEAWRCLQQTSRTGARRMSSTSLQQTSVQGFCQAAEKSS